MSTKSYTLGTYETLQVYCNFSKEFKLAYFSTESAIEKAKIPIRHEHFFNYDNKPIFMLEVEGQNIDPSYGTLLPYKTVKTRFSDYFYYVPFPSDFNPDTMEVVFAFDSELYSPSEFKMSNESVSHELYIQKDKRGVTNAPSLGYMAILDRDTRELIAHSGSSYQGSWEGNNASTDPFQAINSGEPTYRTIELLKASFVMQGIDKVFKTKSAVEYYIETGEEIGRIDVDDDNLAEDREVTLYYESDIISRSYNSSTTNRVGSSAIHFRVQYKNNKGEEIVNPYRAICGYVAPNNEPNDTNNFGNIIWIANNNINLLETSQNPVIGAQRTSKTIPTYNNTTGFYPPYIDNNTIYDARYRTNMRIFANEQDAIDFLSGGNPTPIGESGNQFNPSGFIGDKTVFNDGHDLNGGGMSSCWIMNESQLEDLANVFTTGLTTVEEDNNGVIVNITKTCARAFASHSEPIDAVVDLFWLPFDPSEFVNTGASSFQLNRDDIASASSLIKVVTESGDTVKAYGQFSFGKSSEFVGNVVGSMGNMFSNTTQKVKNVSE